MEAGRVNDRGGCAFLLLFPPIVIVAAEVLAWWLKP